MRRVLSKANNNQALIELVTYDEMTMEERDAIKIPTNHRIEDYKTFQIRHNKQGELIGVKGYKFIQKVSDELRRESLQPDILDLYVAYGESETPIRASDRKAARNKFKRVKVAKKAAKYVRGQK